MTELKNNNNDVRAVEYFLNLKQLYQDQRSPWEDKWRQALSAYHLKDDLNKVYEGRANIRIPIIQWKVNGIVSRINRILFNVFPFGRIEQKNKKKEGVKKGVVDLWNKYIFEKQLDTINFKKEFKQFIKNKTNLNNLLRIKRLKVLALLKSHKNMKKKSLRILMISIQRLKWLRMILLLEIYC